MVRRCRFWGAAWAPSGPTGPYYEEDEAPPALIAGTCKAAIVEVLRATGEPMQLSGVVRQLESIGRRHSPATVGCLLAHLVREGTVKKDKIPGRAGVYSVPRRPGVR